MESKNLVEIALEIKCVRSDIVLNKDKIYNLSKCFHERSFSNQELKKLSILLGDDLHSSPEFNSVLKSFDAIIELISQGGQYEKII